MKSGTIQSGQTSIRQDLYAFGNEKLTFSPLIANSVCHLLCNLLLLVKKYFITFSSCCFFEISAHILSTSCSCSLMHSRSLIWYSCPLFASCVNRCEFTARRSSHLSLLNQDKYGFINIVLWCNLLFFQQDYK